MVDRVLSVSTGGTYGAWEAGVLKALVERSEREGKDRPWQAMYGASAGAFNVAFISMFASQGTGVRALADYWVDHADESQGVRMGLFDACVRYCGNKSSLLDLAVLEPLLRGLDFNRVGAFTPTWVAVTNVKAQRGELKRLENPSNLSGARLVDVREGNRMLLLASMSVPGLFEEVTYKNVTYLDPLLTIPVPNPQNAEKVAWLDVVVAPKSPLQPGKDLISVMQNSLEILMNTATNASIAAIANHYHKKAHLWTKPLRTVVPSFLTLDKNLARALVNEGYKLAANPNNEQLGAPQIDYSALIVAPTGARIM